MKRSIRVGLLASCLAMSSAGFARAPQSPESISAAKDASDALGRLDADEAIRLLDKALEDPKWSAGRRASLLDLRSQAWKAKKDPAKALDDLNVAVRLTPEDGARYRSRGLVFLNDTQQFDRAGADFARAIELNPKDDLAWRGQGYVSMHNKDYDDAIADFTKAIQLNPKASDAFGTRSLALELKGDLAGALADHQEAARLNPAYQLALDEFKFRHDPKQTTPVEAGTRILVMGSVPFYPTSDSGASAAKMTRTLQVSFSNGVSERLKALGCSPSVAINEDFTMKDVDYLRHRIALASQDDVITMQIVAEKLAQGPKISLLARFFPISYTTDKDGKKAFRLKEGYDRAFVLMSPVGPDERNSSASELGRRFVEELKAKGLLAAPEH